MYKLVFIFFLIVMTLSAGAQSDKYIEIGTFNIRFFPCNQDDEMMKKYDINLRYPANGVATDTVMLFEMIKDLDIEVLGVQEIVDPPLFGAMAKRHLGEQYEFAYAPSNGWQKVGFLYNSERVKLVGKPTIYNSVTLGRVDRLRPAFHGYFKAIPDGFDFHVIVLHLKASPRGYGDRKQQWKELKKILSELPNDERNDADVVMVGDFNNVSSDRYNEFLPILDSLNYFWIGTENDSLISSYWRPDYTKPELQSSMIDQIVISDDAKIEYLENRTKAGGLCAEGHETVTGEFPDYYLKISDHCPVYSSFRAFPDDD